MSPEVGIVAALALVSVLGVVCSIHLLRRAPDWPVRILTILLGLMPIYHTISAAVETRVIYFPTADRWRIVSDLTINVLLLISIFLLEFSVEEGRKFRVQLRVMEAAAAVGSPASRPFTVARAESNPALSAAQLTDEA
ncbi:MAG: hypothetical protein IT160_16100 [Bryobacterales bacterium]|nr:hypothetical protein [Bryobacterales bacterium]